LDPLTHALAGSLVADAGFRRRLGPRAAWFGAAVAVWPDLDMVLGVTGDTALLYATHRGLTHSWALWAVLSPLLGWLGYRWARRGVSASSASSAPSDPSDPALPAGPGRYRGWLCLAALAWLTHIALDCANQYGTMVWQPFSDRRVSLNALPVIDVPLTAGLACAWLAVRLLRRRPSPAGLRGRWATGAARAALALSVAYALQGYRIGRTLEQRPALAESAPSASGGPPVALVAMPLLGSNRLWRVVARDAGGRVGVALYSARAPRPLAFDWRPGLDPDRWEKARGHPEVRRFVRFTQGAFSAEEDLPPDGLHVRLVDRRHGTLADRDAAVFGLRLRFAPDGGPLVETLPLARPPRMSLRREWALLWRLYWTGDPA